MLPARIDALSGDVLNVVDQYAHQIVSGELPAGKYHRLSCARHLRDRERERTDLAYPFRFDIAKAERFFRFAEKLRHYKGRQWAGKPIALTTCQKFQLGCLFGWRVKATGLRRFTTSYSEEPRKQGKSLKAAIVALYVTFFEGEMGAEGYVLATKEAQAKIVFNDCTRLVKSSGLKTRIRIQAKNLHREDSASKLEPLGSDSEKTDGLNPSLIVMDELHAQKNRGLMDVMETATGSRLNPLNYQITTAGNDPVSPGGDQHDYACKILERTIVDDATEAFFAFIAHADPDDDWLSEATWRKANPHYGISVVPDDIRKLALKAKNIPAAAAQFKQKRLNLWVNASEPCLSIDGWRAGQSTNVSRETFRAALLHEPCYIGIDLASKLDLCALSLFFPPAPGRARWCAIQYIWTPEATLRERAHRDRAPYPVWVEQGWLRVSPGTSINHRLLLPVIEEARRDFDVQLIGYDKWHADTLKHGLEDDGWATEGDQANVIEVPQTYAGMSAAEASFQAEVLAGNVDANGCPVTAWAIGNVRDQQDGKGNIFFTKKKSRGRIDPVKSFTIAVANWLRHTTKRAPEYQIMVLGGR